MGGFETPEVIIEELTGAIRTAEWYVRLKKKWEMTRIPISSYDWPKVPMFFADIISEALAEPTIKFRDLVDIAGDYGLVGPHTHLLFDLVFKGEILGQVGPDAGELTEFRISPLFLDQLKRQGLLVEKVPTVAPRVEEASIAPKILISIMPEFAKKIFAGVKKIELRKRRPKFLRPKDHALVYASAPLQAIVGEIEIEDIMEGPPQEIWAKYSEASGVSKEFFDSYYQDHSTAAGLLIGKTFEYPTKISLNEMRQAKPRFSPPQNYLYLTEDDPLLTLVKKSPGSLKIDGQPT